MPKKRNSAYYRRRLEKEHPAIYRDLLSGKYPSVRKAAAAAGLIHLPTRLHALKREWIRASPVERAEFGRWIRTGAPAKRRLAVPTIADREGRLRPNVRSFLSLWVKTNKTTPGRIMEAIGSTNYDWRLSCAIYKGERLPNDVLAKLGSWLTKEGYSPRWHGPTRSA